MSFFAELKRRNVVRVGAAYAAIGWLLAQLAEFAVDNFDMPVWILQYLVIALLLGFPVILFLAWRFELTQDGFELDEDVDRSRPAVSHRKLDFTIIAVLSVAVAFLLLDRFFLADRVGTNQASAATRETVAVLPFANMSDDSDHFADGLSEELLNLLAKNPDLKVAGRTSSFSFKGESPNLQEVGEVLNVNYVLEGSVRRSGDQLRITAQLIKAEDGFHAWTETYDRQLADIFDIQDEVAGAIARQLKLRLAPPAKHPTGNPDAYAIYLESLAKLNFRNTDPAQVAIELEDAVALDPAFAQAYELMAKAYWAASGQTMDTPEARQRIFDAATKAVELDPSLAVARVYAISTSVETPWMAEFDAMAEALSTNPEDINLINHHCYNLKVTGYLREVQSCARRLIELEPLSLLGYHRLAEAQSALSMREDARSNWTKGSEVAGNQATDWLLFDSLVHRDYQQAIDYFEQNFQPEQIGRSEFRTFVNGAAEPDTGKQFLDQQIAEMVNGARRNLGKVVGYQWYLFFGHVNDYWAAIDDLTGDSSSIWSDAEPLLFYGSVWPQSGFIQHPSYLEYAHENGLIELWEIRGPPDFCSQSNGEWLCE
jgi:TolB-like protein